MDIERIAGHRLFHQLCFERACLGLGLAAAMASAYFAYILTIAFRPSLLGTPIHDGSVITWGIVVGASILSLGFLLTAAYVAVANTRLDNLSNRLQEDLL